MQGMGWTCLEELVWGDSDHSWVRPAGTLFTRGPGENPPPPPPPPSLLPALSLHRDLNWPAAPLSWRGGRVCVR